MKAPGPERLRVALIDDHPFVREGVRAVLEASTAIEVVGEGASFDEGLELAERVSPSLMLIDIGLGERSGILLTEALALRFPAIRVVILSMYERATYLDSARRAGARGYVSKSASPQVLLAAIHSVAAGLVVGFESPMGASPVELLTPRELQVARLCARDFSDKEAASELAISVRTLESHRQKIAQKLRHLRPVINPTPVGLGRWLREWGLLEDRT